MSQMPYWYRKQQLEHQLKDVLTSPYTDQADFAAAKEAIKQKLAQQDRDYARQQTTKVNKYLKQL